jgi:hypothetical protein
MSIDEEGSVHDIVIKQSVLLKEIARRLILIEGKVDDMPCNKNTAKLDMQEKIVIGLVCFSGTLTITIIANIDKIHKVLS